MLIGRTIITCAFKIPIFPIAINFFSGLDSLHDPRARASHPPLPPADQQRVDQHRHRQTKTPSCQTFSKIFQDFNFFNHFR